MHLQVAGSGWKLELEGQPASDAPQEPQFSSWEDVINKINGRSSGGSTSTSTSSGGSAAGTSGGAGGGGVAEVAYYTLLGVAPTATAAELKSAYRKLALQLHPDVSDAADAPERFAAVAAAYDVLSDPESRTLYDRHGAEGMRGKSGGLAPLIAHRCWCCTDGTTPPCQHDYTACNTSAATAVLGVLTRGVLHGRNRRSACRRVGGQRQRLPGVE